MALLCRQEIAKKRKILKGYADATLISKQIYLVQCEETHHPLFLLNHKLKLKLGRDEKTLSPLFGI